MRVGTGTRAAHLTDAEFNQLLDGAEPGAPAATHLAVCAICRAEIQAVQGALGSFRMLSTAWAEAEAPRRIAVPVGWLKGLQLRTSWSAGLAATAITGMLAFWLGLPGQTVAYGPHEPGVYAPATLPTNAELAKDNDLLLSIDQELSAPGQPEMSTERLQVVPPRSEPRAAGMMTD